MKKRVIGQTLKCVSEESALLMCAIFSSSIRSGVFCLETGTLCRNFSVFKRPKSNIPFQGKSDYRISKTIKHAYQMEGIKNYSCFKFSEYDCIGFDLDNTLCEYKIASSVKMEYDGLSEYLVKEKCYDGHYLLKPLDKEDIDFFQKGLIIDFMRGNLVQISKDGVILKASHGTNMMSISDIMTAYGEERKWDVAQEFTSDILSARNGPLEDKMRSLLDYFDMPASLVFARIVDSLDEKLGRAADFYNIWPDVLDGLVYMYKREHFAQDKGGFFPWIKSDPNKYINKCDPKVKEWLRKAKSSKITFLLTGSNVDYASFTARQCLGDDWASLFHTVVCYARKPGFFIGGRPFIDVKGVTEGDPITAADLRFDKIYSQGNWQELYQFFSRKLGKKNPKCVYVGDNLIQDIYVPSEYTKLDTVVMSEELSAEGMANEASCRHSSPDILKSKYWGSYFIDEDSMTETLWGSIIKEYTKMCVPSMTYIAERPLDFEYSIFSKNLSNEENLFGFYPSYPEILSKQQKVAKTVQ